MLKILSQQKRALGTSVVLTLVGPDPLILESLLSEHWMTIDSFEAKYSRFLSTSELTMVNMAAGKKTKVSEEFIDLLNVCKHASYQTGGIFNPFVLPILQQAGYRDSLEVNPKQIEAPDFSKREAHEFSEIQFGDNWVKLPKNSALDFGGCGKGYLADKLAAKTDTNHDVTGYWFSLGGDIVANGYDDKNKPWIISVQDANNPTKDKASIALVNKRLAIATSGTIMRRGRNWHHLIDNSAGKPAETDILLATVCHSSAVLADILATCAVIAGIKQAKKLLQDNGVTDFLLQTKSNNAYEGELIRGYN